MKTFRVALRGCLLALTLSSTACTSNRFQLANDPRINRDAELAFLDKARQRVPTEPGAVPITAPLEGPPATGVAVAPPPPPDIPATGYPPKPVSAPIVEGDAESGSTAGLDAGNEGLNNRPHVRETPRPGPPGTRLDVVGDATSILGRVVNQYGRQEPSVSIRILDLSEGRRVVAELSTGPDGRFRAVNLQPGVQYEIMAATATAGFRYVGSTVAVAPQTNTIVRLEPENRGARLANFSGWPSTRPANSTGRDPSQDYAPAGSGAFSRSVRISAPRLLPATRSSSEDDATTRVSPYPLPPLAESNPAPTTLPIESAPVRVPVANEFREERLNSMPVIGIDGRRRRLGEFAGDLVLFDFFGSWCGPCRAATPHLNALHRRYAAKGLRIVGIASENGTAAERLARLTSIQAKLRIEYSLALSIAAMGEPCPVRDGFSVQRFPTFVLLNRSGEILFQGEGAGAASLSRLDAAVRANLPR